MNIIIKRGDKMFTITEAAYQTIAKSIENETPSNGDKLYIRLTMGIG